MPSPPPRWWAPASSRPPATRSQPVLDATGVDAPESVLVAHGGVSSRPHGRHWRGWRPSAPGPHWSVWSRGSSHPPAGAVVATVAAALRRPVLVGATRPDVVDVRVVVVQLVVVTAVLIGYIALFTLLASLLEVILGRPPRSPNTVAGALATLPLPALRTALRGVVDELLFGLRADPLDAATHVAGSVEGSGASPCAPCARHSTCRMPCCGLRGRASPRRGGQRRARRRSRSPSGRTSSVSSKWGLRPGEVSLSGDDRNVLALVAPFSALTARSAALAAALQESRGSRSRRSRRSTPPPAPRPARRARPAPGRHRLHR